MDLYEYQGKELFRRYGIPVSDGVLATSTADARAAAGRRPLVVMSDVMVGAPGGTREYEIIGVSYVA